jgi:hypothetical protein
MPPSARDFERAARELRRLNRRNDWLLRAYRSCDLHEFFVSLQEELEAIANAQFLSWVAHTILKVASALRLEGD